MSADPDAQSATRDTHGGGHNVKVGNWVAVVLIVVGAVLLGFALPTHSMVLSIVGAVVLLAGAVTGIVFRIFDDAY